MEKRILYGLVVMLMYLVSSGFSQVQSQETEWERFLMDTQQPILLTLTSTLCGVPCDILEEQVTQLARYYGNRISFYTTNILEKPFFTRLYKVVNVPTIIVFKDGKEIMRLENGFYWGAVYDLIFKANIFAPSESALPPSDSPSPGPSLSFESEVKWIYGEAAWDKIMIEVQVPILVVATSPLCGAPCAILDDQMNQLAKTCGDQIMFYKTNILENPFFAKLYKIFNVPTVIIFKDGEVIIRYENLSDWGTLYDLIFNSRIFDSALPPSDSDPALPLPPLSGK